MLLTKFHFCATRTYIQRHAVSGFMAAYLVGGCDGC